MKKFISHIITVIGFLILSSCYRGDIGSGIKPNDGTVTVTFDFSRDFNNANLGTKSGVINIATSREAKIRRAFLFVFENKNPIMIGDSIVAADPNGRLLQFAEASLKSGEAFIAQARAIEQPGTAVTLIGVANLPDTTYQKIFDAYDEGNTPEGFGSGDYVTLNSFSQLSQLALKTEIEEGKVVVPDSEMVLSNHPNGILPLSIDPVFISSFVQDSVDLQVSKGKFATQFGYTRIDVVVEPEVGSTSDIKLIEACLSQVPTIPLYFGDPTSVNYVDRTQLVNRSTNINTGEQVNADDPNNHHLIQGLYTYPLIVNPASGRIHRSYVIVKAQTSVSDEDGEYYKILIQHNPNTGYGASLITEDYSLYRDMRYRMVIRDFIGNGYLTLNEAIDGEPSNVKYEIIVDPDRGNEFVVTNGTVYMALSNTHIDIFGEGASIQDKEFTALTVFYDTNNKAGNINDPKKHIHIEKNGVNVGKGTSIGIEMVDSAGFTNMQDSTTFELKMKITNPALFTANDREADIVVRVGDLMQKITFRHIPLGNDDTEISTYTDAFHRDNYEYAYFVPQEPNDYKPWIYFEGNNTMEYNAEPGTGVPISFPILTQGQRDNFECPIFLYNKDGTSTRTLVYQESFELLDFSNRDSVNRFLAINEPNLVLSNCYILNPSTTKTRKYIIPIEQRINEFLGEPLYISSGESAPYDSLPDNWAVKASWYDSQRIYDGGLVFSKEGEVNGQDCISTTLPANFQQFGTMLVTVYVPSSEGSTTGTNLWHWVIWVTDYNPYSILRSKAVKDNITGTGVYFTNGDSDIVGEFIDYKDVIPETTTSGTTPSGPNPYSSALHRYQGGNWDVEPSGTINYGSNIGRLIMDRNNGAFSATYSGHGGVMNATTGASSTNPVSGWLVYQTGNIVPYPGAGAVYADGSPLSIIGTKQYASFRKVIQNPQNFYYGSGKYSYSTWLDNREVTGPDTGYNGNQSRYVVYDVNLPKTSSSSYNVKSIFDGSPLGFMAPSFGTFHVMNDLGSVSRNYNSSYLSHDVSWPRNTAAVYRNFAYFYHVGFRTSGGGAFRLGKNYEPGVYLRVTRPNLWWSTWSSGMYGGYQNSAASKRPGIQPIVDAGDGGAIQLRPVTQFRYD